MRRVGTETARVCAEERDLFSADKIGTRPLGVDASEGRPWIARVLWRWVLRPSTPYVTLEGT